jgi:hypothetical protein
MKFRTPTARQIEKKRQQAERRARSRERTITRNAERRTMTELNTEPFDEVYDGIVYVEIRSGPDGSQRAYRYSVQDGVHYVEVRPVKPALNLLRMRVDEKMAVRLK